MSKSKIILFTGATSGLGKISALKAAENGASLIVIARNKAKGEALKQEFHSQFPDSEGKIEVIQGDLNSFESIVVACTEIKLKYPAIDVIVNNAGIMNFEFRSTIDNIEETLQVNLLSPLLICDLLFNNLKKTENPKIIFTSSGLHQGNVNFEDLEFKDSFSSFKVYRQSKLGVILICRYLAKSLADHNISIYSQHPGVVRTNLGKDASWFSKLVFFIMGKSPKKGSETLSFLIETASKELISGEYYSNKKVTPTTKESNNLETAEKLLLTVGEYLRKHTTLISPIFIRKT